MKKTLFFLLVFAMFTTVSAQSQSASNSFTFPCVDASYRLYSTNNMWTYIKLNTRNGQMWQVQWDTGKNRFESPLSLKALVAPDQEKNNRFALSPTTNIYNFILLDQVDGRVWQVQWSNKPEERAILAIE
ncbi:hypothetical protein ACHRVK_18620 [Flavobacterium plurextorum]|uniref:Uncharacterized protein n=2 Tax=Flavobacterium TaxID=237 RepID=A0A9X1KQ97_9FLAO|nr:MULTISPECIES: hypothetical protein [Flavobacterium]MBW1658637.1 hypothetical protein [Flavobacterium quisquiliarum]MBZ4035260.1 hypothetical protein [Flavobacterium potami]WET02510.1 hypothetical protein P0R33_22405 [Flavobacterium sp. YJ01]